MRLLHSADIHLGLAGRTEDLRRCWLHACNIAAEREVDVVVVAGDVFHGRDPDAQALNAWHSGLRVLNENDIPALVIAGNHDGAPHPGRRSVLEVFDSADIDVVTSPRVVTVGGVRIACLPWVSRQQLLAQYPGMSRETAVQSMTDGLERILDKLRTESADVLTAHWSIQGAVLGNERDIAIVGQDEVVLPLASIEGPWSYAALGHIHGMQRGELDQGAWAYSGSVDRMNFGEEHEDKFALEVDLDHEATSVTLHQLPARRFVTIDYTGDWSDYGGNDTGDLEGAICRIRAEVSEGQSTARLEDHKRHLRERGAAIVQIQRMIVRETRARAERVTTSLSVTDAMHEWLDMRGVDGRKRMEIRKLVRSLEDDAGAVVGGAHVGDAIPEDGSSPAPRSEEVQV